VLAQGKGADSEACVESWMQGNAQAVDRCRQVLGDLQAGTQADFTMLSVAMGEIRALQRGS
jgi:NAD-specific glutamate dehydrogenase